MANGVVSTCSHHGSLQNGKCVCHNGWTGVGDFNPLSGLDCGIDVVAIEILAYISVVFGMVTMLQYFVFLIHRRFFVQAKFSKKDQFALTYFIQTLTANVYIIVLIINPNEAVFGHSIAVTIMIWIAYLTAYGGATIFFEAVMDLLLSISRVMSLDARQKMKVSISQFMQRTKYLYVICFLCSLTGLSGLFVSEENCKTTGIVWFYSWEVYMFFFMMTFNPPVSLLRSELALTIKDHLSLGNSSRNDFTSALRGIVFNITLVQITLNFIFILTSILFILWANIDFLMRRAVYLTLYCSLGVHIFSIPMLLALTYKPNLSAPPAIVVSSVLVTDIPPTSMA